MHTARCPRRPAPRWILLATLLVLLAACDDPTTLSTKEKGIAVGATAGSICWDQETGLATTQVIATVFGRDGSVASGTSVRFEADVAEATLDPAEARTDDTGRAIVELSTPRPADDRVTVTGYLPDGRSDEVTIQVPAPPFLQFTPETFQPAVGDEFFLHWYVTAPCNLSRLTVELTWDPDVLEYLPGEWEEGGILNQLVSDQGDGTGDASGDGSAGGEDRVPTVVEESSADGWLRITYRRDDSPRTGVSATGSYLRIRFRAIAPGDADMNAPLVELAPPDDRPFDMTGRWAVPAITVVEGDGNGGT